MDYMQFLSDFLEILLAALLPVAVGFAVAYLKALTEKKLAEIKSEWPDAFSVVEMIAAQVVAAAEQAGAAELIDDKKEFALDMAKKWLLQYDLDIDLDLISAAIEAEVIRQFKKE